LIVVIGELTLVTVIVVIEDFTVVTVKEVIGGAYYSGTKGSLV
jgi:hypothetical protein